MKAGRVRQSGDDQIEGLGLLDWQCDMIIIDVPPVLAGTARNSVDPRIAAGSGYSYHYIAIGLPTDVCAA